MGKALTPAEAARVYDRIGRFQDWQAFYEGSAVGDLIAHVHLDSAGGLLLERGWVTEYRELVEARGVASEVIGATPTPRALGHQGPCS